MSLIKLPHFQVVSHSVDTAGWADKRRYRRLIPDMFETITGCLWIITKSSLKNSALEKPKHFQLCL